MKISKERLEQIGATEGFKLTKELIAGEECYFIHPEGVAPPWDESNLIFRSSVWNSEGELISASYPKFFNLEEKPAITPFNGNLEGCSAVEKIDGSCLIVSAYNGKEIIRTRGTVDARKMANGNEIDLFHKKFGHLTMSDSTFIYEWVSPRNQIIIPYSEPDFYLTGAIHHKDYSLYSQDALDLIAKAEGIKRPARHQFNTLAELVESIKKWEGKEGVCLYYNNGQNIRKIKGAWYLKLHAFKGNCSLKTLLDLYFELKKPEQSQIESYIEKQFDFECLKRAKEILDVLYNKGINPSLQRIEELKVFVEQNKQLDQKSFAVSVMKAYKEHGIAFALRKGIVPDKAIRNLIEEKLS